MSETRRLLRDALGWLVVELRQRRVVDTRIEVKLDSIASDLKHLIKLAGGTDAKTQALREDHDALVSRVQGIHERLTAERRPAG